jgi:hypothetical protein
MSQTSIPDNQTLTLPAGSIVQLLSDVSLVNEEASTEIPFGRMVQFGTADTDMKILAGASPTDLAGVLTTEGGAYVPDLQLGTTGVKPDQVGRVLRLGLIWVFSETGNAPSDAVHVRHTVDTGKLIGNFTKTADANKTFLITGAKWMKTTTAEGLTLLWIDVGSMVVTADT